MSLARTFVTLASGADPECDWRPVISFEGGAEGARQFVDAPLDPLDFAAFLLCHASDEQLDACMFHGFEEFCEAFLIDENEEV